MADQAPDRTEILKTVLDFGLHEIEEPQSPPRQEAFNAEEFFAEHPRRSVVFASSEELNQAVEVILTHLGNPRFMQAFGERKLFYYDLRDLITAAGHYPVDNRFVVAGMYLLLQLKDSIGEEIYDTFYLEWSQGWERGIPNDPYLERGRIWIEYLDAIEMKLHRKIPTAGCLAELTSRYREKLKK